MNHSYGLITEHDAQTLEATLTLACLAFPSGVIHVTEIGVHRGHTARGIQRYVCNVRGRRLYYTGVDNQKDLPITKPVDEGILLLGDSVEVSGRIEDNSQHVVIVDGDHSLKGTRRDFEAYSDKLKRGGYLMFHDTSTYIPEMKDYQNGPKDDPGSYISCRWAVAELGLLESENWQLVFDESDKTSATGGYMVFKKII